MNLSLTVFCTYTANIGDDIIGYATQTSERRL